METVLPIWLLESICKQETQDYNHTASSYPSFVRDFPNYISIYIYFKAFFIMFVAILNLYLILALLASVRVFKHLKGALYSVFTFIILHVGYGLGYLNGIIDFALIGKNLLINTKLSLDNSIWAIINLRL